jgi:hypothetical protein
MQGDFRTSIQREIAICCGEIFVTARAGDRWLGLGCVLINFCDVRFALITTALGQAQQTTPRAMCGQLRGGKGLRMRR